MRRAAYWLVYFLWVIVPSGMGAPPWHRWNSVFKFEGSWIAESLKGGRK